MALAQVHLRPTAAVLLSAALLGPACAGGQKRAEPSPAPAPAAAAPNAVDALAALSEEYWQYQLQESPEYATILGDHRYDARLQDITDAGRARRLETERALLARAQAIDAAALSPREALTRELLIVELQSSIEASAFAFHTFDVDQLGGPQSGGFALLVRKYHPRSSVQDVENLAARLEAFGPWMDAYLGNLQAGLDAGRTAPRVVVERVLAQLAELTAEQPDRSSFLPTSFPDGVTPELRERLARAARDVVHPAYARMQSFLATTYLPRAREQVGVSAMPGGREIYTYLIKRHTTRALAPDEVHQMGLAELDRVEAQMMEIALSQKHPRGQKLSDFTDRIRKDQKNFPRDASQLMEVYRQSLQRAQTALPRAFDVLPTVDVEVVEMDATRAPHAPAAYYEEADLQGTRKAQFVANTFKPTTRALFNADALTFHEAVPGHHLQIGLAHDLKDIPQFRKTLGFGAYVEGWALYSEKLADELGLYASPLARYGYLGMRAWRASRLVVDTGMHAKGWTRAQAIEFMKEHTSLTQIDIENEVDRYIMWPGQALGYMVGALEIDALRKQAEDALGPAFDLRKFHAAVLMDGAVPLHLLRRNVEAYIQRSRAP